MKTRVIPLTLLALLLFAGLSMPGASAQSAEQGVVQLGLNDEGRLSPEIDLGASTPASETKHPAVAYNSVHGEYMVVWYNDRPSTKDIYARRVSQTGELLSWFAVSSAPNCKHPDIAYSPAGDRYLVVWSQFNVPEARWEIYGRIVAWNAPGTGSPFYIAGWSSMNLELPAVAWNSDRNEYMVVWQTSLTTSGQLLGIGRRRLDSTGGALSNADYITGEGTTNQGSPDVAYHPGTGRYLAVWAEPVVVTTTVHGGLLNDQGALQGTKIALYSSGFEQQKPAVTANETNRFMVVWQEMRGSDWDIYGREVNGTTGQPLLLTWLVAITYDHETTPAIACSPSTGAYTTVWEQSSPSGRAIAGVRWGGESSVPSRSFEAAPGGMGDNESPAIASGPPGYMIAYSWQSFTPGSERGMYGRVWWPEAIYLPLSLRQ